MKNTLQRSKKEIINMLSESELSYGTWREVRLLATRKEKETLNEKYQLNRIFEAFCRNQKVKPDYIIGYKRSRTKAVLKRIFVSVYIKIYGNTPNPESIPHGLGQQLSKLLDISPSMGSRIINEALFSYINYTDFRELTDNIAEQLNNEV